MKEREKFLKRRLQKGFVDLLRPDADTNLRTKRHKESSLNQLLEDKLMLVEAIQQGVPYSLFQVIRDYSPFSEKEWANYLGLNIKSLQRYRIQPNYRFKPLHSEKIMELFEVTNAGRYVFGSLEKYKHWLDTPSYALGGKAPAQLLNDSYGKDLVLAELTRINHGILA